MLIVSAWNITTSVVDIQIIVPVTTELKDISTRVPHVNRTGTEAVRTYEYTNVYPNKTFRREMLSH